MAKSFPLLGKAVKLAHMDATNRRELAHKRAVRAMRIIRANIDATPDINITEAAKSAGISPSTLYRWLEAPPEKIDMAAIASLADWLHDTHGYQDFIAVYRQASHEIVV